MATERIIKTTFKVRRGFSNIWSDIDPVLQAGEPGYELDTHRLKIGDGEKKWTQLPYIGGESTTVPEINDYITKDELKNLVNEIIKSSDDENKIKILADGTMEINSLNISKLIQSEDSVIILNGSN